MRHSRTNATSLIVIVASFVRCPRFPRDRRIPWAYLRCGIRLVPVSGGAIPRNPGGRGAPRPTARASAPRPGQSPYTCVPPEHKPVRRGREMIDLLAVEERKPKPAKIRAVYEAAIDQLFKRMRSSSSALTQQAVDTLRGPVPNERRRRRPPNEENLVVP